VELECLEVTESWKTLGFKTTPTGDTFEHMLEASQKWAAQIKASNLREMDACGSPVHYLENSRVSPYMYNIDREAM
jgi:hypothetical protein